MDDFKIGTTVLKQSTSRKWAKLQPGDNIFRVLPPVHSLAEKGEYTKFYAFHGGFRNSSGRVNMFQCIQKTEKGTGLITEHCPVCDVVTEKIGQYNLLKKAKESGQATEDQVKKFWNEQIFPYRVQKSFFFNVLDQNNEFYILPAPYKAWKALDYLLRQEREKGQDPTALNGCFIKFGKIQDRKGDKDVTYTAELAMIRSGNNFSLMGHVLTPELIQAAKTGAADLGNLYRVISAQDMAQLVSTAPEHRAGVVDRIFGNGKENTKPTVQNPLSTNIPGTTAQAVGRVEYGGPGGFNVQSPAQQVGVPPTVYGNTQPAPQQSAPAGYGAGPTPVAPSAAPVAAPAVGQTQLSGQADDMSDEDFAKIFNL